MELYGALKKYFGYEAFRPLQREIVEDALAGRDWVLSNNDLRGWARRLWRIDQPYQYTGSSGGAGGTS